MKLASCIIDVCNVQAHVFGGGGGVSIIQSVTLQSNPFSTQENDA